MLFNLSIIHVLLFLLIAIQKSVPDFSPFVSSPHEYILGALWCVGLAQHVPAMPNISTCFRENLHSLGVFLPVQSNPV